MKSAIRVKRSTLEALSLVSPAERVPEPSTWKLLERPTRASRRRKAEPPAPDDLGARLHATRRHKRISLRTAAEATCIPARYLEALERNSPIDAFPGAAYAKGFLRIYAHYLGVPETLLDGRFDDESPALDSLAVFHRAAEPRRRRWREWILVGVLLVAAVVVGIGGARPAPKQRSHPLLGLQPAAAALVGQSSSGPSEDAAPARTVTAPQAGPLAVTIRLTGRSSWIRVVADGKPVVGGFIAHSGYETRFTAHRSIEITVGNAGAVDLLVGGVWSGPLGGSGAVKRVSIVEVGGVPTLRTLGAK